MQRAHPGPLASFAVIEEDSGPDAGVRVRCRGCGAVWAFRKGTLRSTAKWTAAREHSRCPGAREPGRRLLVGVNEGQQPLDHAVPEGDPERRALCGRHVEHVSRQVLFDPGCSWSCRHCSKHVYAERARGRV